MAVCRMQQRVLMCVHRHLLLPFPCEIGHGKAESLRWVKFETVLVTSPNKKRRVTGGVPAATIVEKGETIYEDRTNGGTAGSPRSEEVTTSNRTTSSLRTELIGHTRRIDNLDIQGFDR